MNRNQLIQQLLNDASFERWVRNPVLNKDDTKYWDHWLKNNAQHTEAVEEARQLLSVVSFKTHPVSESRITKSWQAVSRRTSDSRSQVVQSPWLRWRFAASITILLIMLASIGYWASDSSAVYETAYGETQTIELKDGTQVTLNGNSRLVMAEDWLNKAQREVFLEGEAYFSVKSRIQQYEKVAFLVQTSDLQVKVLGTQFNVNSRRGQTQVVLDEGKVALEIPDKEAATMNPGEYVVYSSEDNMIKKIKVNPDIYTSWRNQQLILDDTPVDQIVQQLEDTYGIKFVLDNQSVLNRRISSTGSISTEDLETVLRALSTLLQVRIEQDHNLIYLYEN